MSTRTSRGSKRKARSDSYHHGDLACALIDATLEIVAESGTSALSLREVARRAGVSHAAPAHHFGDKAGLVTAAAVRGFERFTAALIEGRDAVGDDPVKRLSASGRAYVRFAIEERPWFELMFRNELADRNAPELVAAREASKRVLVDAAAAAQAAGYARSTDSSALVTSSWAMAHGLATLWLDGNLGDPSRRGQLESILDEVFGAV